MTVRMGNIDPGQGQETDQETDHIGDVVEADLAIVADAIADIEVEVGHVIVTVDTAEDKFLCVNNKLKLKNLWIQRHAFYYWIVKADSSFRNMGFDNFGQTILVKCALLGDAAVGKTAISQALGAFFTCNFFIQT